MTHDTGLVEAVAIAIWDGGYRQTWADNLDENDRKYYLDCARAALDAVNASGTHTITPVETFSELDRLVAEQAAVEGLLWGLPANDAVGHLAFTRRLEDVKERIHELLTASKEQP